jgi:hypothetical protein
MVIGNRLSEVRKEKKVTSKSAQGCFGVTSPASRMGTRFLPLQRWRRWRARWKFPRWRRTSESARRFQTGIW